MIRTATRTLLAVALLGVAWMALASTSASAAYKHNVLEKTFSTACNTPGASGHIDDIAVHEASQTIYVFCVGFGESGQGGKILKYNYNGSPVEFSANVPYVSENAIIENPASPTGSMNAGFSGDKLSVDNSGGPSDGYIYVVSGGSENLDVFKPSGEYSASKIQPYCAGQPYDVEVGPDGFVYFAFGGFCARISKYSPSLQEVGRFHIKTREPGPFTSGSKLTVDSSGALWLLVGNALFKIEADQFRTEFPPSPLGSDMEALEFEPSPFAPYPFLQASNVGAPDVDLTTNDLYVNRGSYVETYSEGNAESIPYKKAPNFGEPTLSGSKATAVTLDHRVFASTEGNKVVRFGVGDILPDVSSHPAEIEDIGHEGATLTADVSLSGGEPITGCELVIGTNTSYSLPPVPCTPGTPYGSDTEVSATVGGLTTGQQYHYTFKATNSKGSNLGIDRTFTPPYVLNVETLSATEVEEHQGKLQGSFDPDGIAGTKYYFKYGVTSGYGQTTPVVEQASTPGNVIVGSTLTGLPAGRVFNYRIIVENENGVTEGPNKTFRTASTPDVTGLSSSDLTATSAVLHAKVNPVGYATKYRFEYGTSPEYGQVAPLPDEELGSGNSAIDVEETVKGLAAGVTYHYRVVAENKWGKSLSSDTTFDYSPPGCPNDHVRQQTGASYLPDCRAYELVSPASAGAVQLFPGSEMEGLASGGQDPYALETGNWVQNDGLATSPPRLAYLGLAGTIKGLRAPNVLTPDTYVATRSNEGWTTTLPGIDDSLGIPFGKQCSDSLGLCIDHSGDLSGEKKNTAPYLYTIDGGYRGRLPTNVNIVKHGLEAPGYKRLSGDFSHFIFSSNEYTGFPGAGPGAVFAPGGLDTGPGSAYDNDLGARTVEVISKLPNGENLPQNGTISGNPSLDYAIEIPAVSTDGSHSLLSTKATAKGPYRLFMRVGGGKGITYEVTPAGSSATEFIGMTRNGSEVLFTTAASLEAGDVDTSVDLYVWKESTDSVTRISKAANEEGAGKDGNRDVCNASWTSKCDVKAVNPEHRWALESEVPFGNPNVPFMSANGIDDVFADQSGDVYFYSPEQLDANGDFGIFGERNLYLYREGTVRLVAIFDTGTQIERMQISADGSHAAMLTKSDLTSYNSAGFAMVYTYDAEHGGDPLCLLPTRRAGAEGERDDQPGRPLHGRRRQSVLHIQRLDWSRVTTTAKSCDVYEYVDGRPQLIIAGLGARDFTGQSEVSACSRFRSPPAWRRSAPTAPTSTSRPSTPWSTRTSTGNSSSSTTPAPAAASRPTRPSRPAPRPTSATARTAPRHHHRRSPRARASARAATSSLRRSSRRRRTSGTRRSRSTGRSTGRQRSTSASGGEMVDRMTARRRR